MDRAMAEQREGWLKHLLMRQDIGLSQSSGITTLYVYSCYKILQHTHSPVGLWFLGKPGEDQTLEAKQRRWKDACFV